MKSLIAFFICLLLISCAGKPEKSEKSIAHFKVNGLSDEALKSISTLEDLIVRSGVPQNHVTKSGNDFIVDFKSSNWAPQIDLYKNYSRYCEVAFNGRMERLEAYSKKYCVANNSVIFAERRNETISLLLDKAGANIMFEEEKAALLARYEIEKRSIKAPTPDVSRYSTKLSIANANIDYTIRSSYPNISITKEITNTGNSPLTIATVPEETFRADNKAYSIVYNVYNSNGVVVAEYFGCNAIKDQLVINPSQTCTVRYQAQVQGIDFQKIDKITVMGKTYPLVPAYYENPEILKRRYDSQIEEIDAKIDKINNYLN